MLAQIVLDGDHGWMHVRFTNDTSQPQFLAKSRALLGQKADSAFLDIQPNAIYRGPVVKRLPYGEEELFELEPGESINSDEFHLHQWYRIPSTKNLSVRYRAAHPLAGLEQAAGPLTTVESDPVTVDTSTSLV